MDELPVAVILLLLLLLFDDDACDLLECTMTDADEPDEIVGYSDVKSVVAVVVPVVVVTGVVVGVDVGPKLPLGIVVPTDDRLLVLGLNNDLIFCSISQ